MKKRYIINLVLIILLSVCSQLFSEIRMFEGKTPRILNADPNQPLIRNSLVIGINDEFKDKSFWETSIGGDAPLLAINNEFKEVFSLCIRGFFQARLKQDNKSLALFNSDYTGGISSLVNYQNRIYDFYLFHKSSHLGDEIILNGNNNYKRINYSREVLRLLFYSDKNEGVKHSYGIHYILRKDVSEKPGRYIMQYDIEIPYKKYFLNADIQSKEEHSWHVDFNIQAGMKLSKKSTNTQQNIVIEYYKGYSNVGQFYDKLEEYISIGVLAYL